VAAASRVNFDSWHSPIAWVPSPRLLGATIEKRAPDFETTQMPNALFS
jgi:hypothetical protein